MSTKRAIRVPKSFSGFRRCVGSVATSLGLRATANMANYVDYEGSQIDAIFYQWTQWQETLSEFAKTYEPVDLAEAIEDEWRHAGLMLVRDSIIDLYSEVNGHSMNDATIKDLDAEIARRQKS